VCLSRLHRVVRTTGVGEVDVEDVEGIVHHVSLLALDAPAPEPGEWLVVHSGYAIKRVDAAEAEAVAAELRRAATGGSAGVAGRRPPA
jgi:hydrogenase maturation factor